MATQGAPPLQVAVIDDDSGFLQVLTKRMEGMGWQHRVTDGPLPPAALVAMRLNAMVVDPAVLGSQAWTYLETVCAEVPSLPVIVCTGRSTVAQRVRGLRAGADDWMTKPCHPEEVIARIEVAVRRRRSVPGAAGAPGAGTTPIVAGELEVRPDQFQAFARGVSAELTRREFELVAMLAGSEGIVLPREDIYERVWGYAMAHGDRSVDVFVRKVRQKLDRVSPGWRYIHTHFGVGYRFAAEPVDAAAVESSDADEEPAPADADVAVGVASVAAA